MNLRAVEIVDLVDALFAFELERAVRDGKSSAYRLLHPLADEMGLFQGGMSGDEDVGGHRPDVTREAPDVKIVDAFDPGDRRDRRGDLDGVDVVGYRFQEHVDACSSYANGLDRDQGRECERDGGIQHEESTGRELDDRGDGDAERREGIEHRGAHHAVLRLRSRLRSTSTSALKPLTSFAIAAITMTMPGRNVEM